MTIRGSDMAAHIVTVGTSLFSNTGGGDRGVYPNRKELLVKLKDAKKSLELSWRNRGFQDHGLNVSAAHRSAIEALCNLDHAEEFRYRLLPDEGEGTPRDRMPQELSYLWKHAKDCLAATSPGGPTKATVRFLCSDSAISKDCAIILRGVLARPPFNQWYEVQGDLATDFAPGVNAWKGDAFVRNGFHAWMGKIKDMIEEMSGHDTVYLNATGGYKGTVPYSTLMAMLYPAKVQIRYLFEESPAIMPIPSYPVGLDFRQWHENALRLRMRRTGIGRQFFHPDAPVSDLLLEDGETLSAFGKSLENQYNRQLHTDPLKVYSSHIVSRMLDDAPRLRKVLTDLVEKTGDMIWLGDKIPEMVEHAQRHHHDLLEFTELLLTPIRAVSPDFLSPNERFVLLSAVLLHDCGHSLDRLSLEACECLQALFGPAFVQGLPREIPLLPNDVRDYHQYLSCIRLNDPKMAGGLGWPGRDGLEATGLGGDLHDAVLLACLFHRRRMFYDRDVGDIPDGQAEAEKGTLHLTGQWPGPLCCHKRAAVVAESTGVDLMKVVALLRLIDGCDSQARRAGAATRIDLSMDILARDYETAALRASQSHASYNQWHKDNPRQKDNPSELHGALSALQVGTASQPWRVNDPRRKLRIACLRAMAEVEESEAGESARQGARLWLTAAEAADRAEMRFNQWPHFLKHRVVSEVQVLPGTGFGAGNLCFEVVLVPDTSGTLINNIFDSADKRTPLEWLDCPVFEAIDPGNTTSLKKSIEEEVKNEYKQVSEHAQKSFGLGVTYWWASERNRRYDGGEPF